MTAIAERRSEVAEKRQDPAASMVKALELSYKSALPAHVTMEHFSRALLTEFRRTPALLECSRESVGAGVLMFAQLGLMVGVNGAGWLIPFNNSRRGCKEAVAVIGYQGLIDLCYRSDRVESISADVVCENDLFEFEQGLNQKLKHIPNLHGPRGEPYAVYAIANIKGSSRPVYVVLNEEEVETVKKASPGAKKSDSPWNGNFEGEMWKKTAVRRLSKYLPKSVELSHALDFENRQAEDLKDADATVLDDPLSPGRHERKRGASRKPETMTAEQAPEEKRPAPESSGAGQQEQAAETVPQEREPGSDDDEQAQDAQAEEDFPREACKDFRELWKLNQRSPRLVAAAIELARGKYDGCATLRDFGNIGCADELQCAQVLECFRLAKGK